MSSPIDDHLNEQLKLKEKLEPPRNYKVILINDDYTPMDFVIVILEKIFKKTNKQAEDIMVEVHETGKGIAGIYPLDIASTKLSQAIQWARHKEHPLTLKLEKE
mgnify:CR=1 FL=1